MPDRGKFKIAAGWIFSDPDCRFVDEVVWRDRQVVRRGDTVKYSPRQIVFRTMTGTKIPAKPIFGRLLCILKRLEQRDAAEMSANANKHSVLGL